MFSMKPSLRFSSRSGKRKGRGGKFRVLRKPFFGENDGFFSRLPFSKWDLWLQKADFRGGKGTPNIFAWASFFPELHLHTLQFRGFLQRRKKEKKVWFSFNRPLPLSFSGYARDFLVGLSFPSPIVIACILWISRNTNASKDGERKHIRDFPVQNGNWDLKAFFFRTCSYRFAISKNLRKLFIAVRYRGGK